MANLSVQVPDQLLGSLKQQTGIDLTTMNQVPQPSMAGGGGEPTSDVPADPSTADPAGALPAADAGGTGPVTANDAATLADPWEAAIEATNQQLDEGLQKQTDAQVAGEGLGGRVFDATAAAGVGIMAGAIHSADAIGDLIGKPPSEYDKRAPIINQILDANAELSRRSVVNGFIGGTAAFVTAMLGVGKFAEITPVVKGITQAPKLVQWGGEVIKGGIAGSLVFDPHGGRLSDLVQRVPALRNPVTAYLSSDPNDSDATGRFKNALEGAGLDVLTAGLLQASVRVWRWAKVVNAADATEADKAIAQTNLKQANADLASEVAKAKSVAEAQKIIKDNGGTGKLPEGAATNNPITVGGAKAKVWAPSRATISILNDMKDAPNAPPAPKPLKPSENVLHTVAETQVRTPTAKKPGAGRTDLPNADLTNDATNMANEMKARAKQEGQSIKVQPGSKATFEEALSHAGPKIETNGVKYQMMEHADFVKLGKSLGVNNERWLAMADRKGGGIWISNKVLAMPASEQAYVIMHETGHSLEGQFVKSVTGKDGMIKDLPPAWQAQLKKVSKQVSDVRAKTWKGATGNNTVKGKAARQYLNAPHELFADGFSMWKNEPEKFRQLAPDVAKEFDTRFAAWRDFDFAAAAEDINGISGAQGLAEKTRAPAVPGGAPKPPRQTDTFVSPRIPRDEEVSSFVKATQADTEALNQYGTKAAAEAAGHKFAQANLPYQKLLNPGGLHMFMGRIAEQFKADLDKMKGGDVLHDTRVEAVIRQRAYLFNEDPNQLMGMLQQAGSHANEMVANMEAAFMIAEKSGDDLHQLVKEINAGNFTQYGGDEAAAWASLGPRLALHLEALGAAQALRSAAGRGLRRLRGDFQLDPGLLNKLRTLDPEAVNRVVLMVNGDRKMLAKVATRGTAERIVRFAGTIFGNNILWLWPSHVRNIIGNTFMMMTSPGTRLVGSFMVKEGGNDIRRQALREYRYMFSGLHDTLEFMKSAYINGDGSLAPHSSGMAMDDTFKLTSGNLGLTGGDAAMNALETGLHGKVQFVQVRTVGDFMSNAAQSAMFAVGQPNRLLGTADEFFKQSAYRAVVLARASIEADDKMLVGEAYHNYLKDSLEASFDASGRGIDQEAMAEALQRTFAQPLADGTLGKSIANLVGQHPILRFVLPFVRTPVNLFRYSWKLTPGLNVLQKEYRNNLLGRMGPRKQAEAWGQMALGGLIMTMGVGLSLSGKITGAGPADPQHLAALKQTGWQPYSIRQDNPDGSHTYLPFNNLDPLGMELSFFGDITQQLTQGMNKDTDIWTVIGATTIAMAHNFANRTYLQSINNMLDAINQPDQRMQGVLAGLGSGMVPFSSLMKEVNTDPYMRDARTIQDRIIAQTPGMSSQLAPVYDVFGNPVQRTMGLAFTDKSSDAAYSEQQRMLTEYGIGLTPLPAQPKGGIDLRTFKLASTGQSAFSEYARLSAKPGGFKKTMQQAIGDLVLSKRYGNMPEGQRDVPGTKLWALGRIVTDYREAAYKELLRENKDLSVATATQQQAMRAAKLTTVTQQQGGASRTSGYVTSVLQNANAVFGIKP